MSAICGIVHFDRAPVDASELTAMIQGSPHRGPDGVRIHTDGNVGFAHLAFHVTPESVDERQPLVSPDGQLVLVADARLDNRAELAGKLGIPGPALCDLSDPELLLRAFRKWGDQCPGHLLGDFVFAIWEPRHQSLFLARDALGARSLSWHRSGQTFVFASETSALLSLARVPAEIDPASIARVLAHLPQSGDQTAFRNIFYLRPAHYLHLSPKGVSGGKYWDIDPAHRISYKQDEAYAEHFLQLLENAVACRLRSVRPAGIALSGGYDSTLLAAIAARQLQRSPAGAQRLRSFSYVFDRNPECDERRFIEPVADRYGLEATWLVSDDLWSFKRLMTQPVPRAEFWRNCYAQLPEAVARAARAAGCGLLLDGEFGDALCGGDSFFAADMLAQGRWPQLFALLWQFRRDMNFRRELLSFGLRPLLPQGLRVAYRSVRPARIDPFVRGLRQHWVDQLQAAMATGPAESAVLRDLSPARRQRYRVLFDPSWPEGYAATRAITYGRFGLERISPYYDRRLVAFVMAIPAEQVGHPGRYRRLQNLAMKGLVPESVRNRRQKTSFEPLLRRGLLVEEKTALARLLRDPLVVRQGWISEVWLRGQLSAGTKWDLEGYPLALCIHLELWLRALEDAAGRRSRWSSPFVLS